MPIHEQEIHPFLNYCDSLKTDWNCFREMVVGTFPIYCLSSSNPIENEGLSEKEKWAEKARFQFFYGSRDNDFWGLVSNSLGEPAPTSQRGCIDLLNNKGIFISGAVAATERKGYSALDSALTNITKNELLQEYLTKGEQIRVVYFTSELSKRLFCEVLGIEYQRALVEQWDGGYRTLILVSLPSPSPSGAKRLPGDELFNKWMYRTHDCITAASWRNYQSWKGKGKLGHFCSLHGLSKDTRLTKEFKQDIYRLAFTKQFDELRTIERAQLPELVLDF